MDELNVTDDVAMACQGNQQCILDLIVTEDGEVAQDTLELEMETNMTVDTISEVLIVIDACIIFLLSFHSANFPPDISAGAVFSVTLRQETAYTIVVEDIGDNFTLSILGELPPNSVLDDMGEGVYVFRWNPLEVTTAPLVFAANDSRGALSIFVPNVEVCACVNGGNCTKDGLLSTNATTILNCMCPEGIFKF